VRLLDIAHQGSAIEMRVARRLLEDTVLYKVLGPDREHLFAQKYRLRAGLNRYRGADEQFVRWRLGQIARALLKDPSYPGDEPSEEAHAVRLDATRVAALREAGDGGCDVVISIR
jgi:hypothetical protein